MLEIDIFEVNDSPVEPRQVELKATDSKGTELKVVIWRTHSISCDWRTGATYEITGGGVKRYENASGPEVRIHSTDDFTINRVDTTSETTQVLVIGDTHVGYRHRSSTDKPSWTKDVDNRDTFKKSLRRARGLDVDAVLHAGDVFDHTTTERDRNHVNEEIQRTTEAGIELYYIHGNHDNKAGKRTLNQSPAVHIAGDAVRSGAEPVQIVGLDHSRGKVSTQPPYGSIKSVEDPSILVIHDTPYPAVDKNGSPMYRSDNNQLDLSSLLDFGGDWLDLIVAGHMHVGRKGSIVGYDIPLLVTGPTSPISSYDDENRPSTWLLTISEGKIEIERQTL